MTPPYDRCPFPGCRGYPVLRGRWWECSTGEPHFLWGKRRTTMETKPLSLDCKPGDHVHWQTHAGERLSGQLKEWDNGTAIVTMPDGNESAVRCA